MKYDRQNAFDEPDENRFFLSFFKSKLFTRLSILSSCAIVLIGIFREPLLLNYGQWLAPNLTEFTSSADVLVFMDVYCPRIDSAAQRVANGEAKALYMFPYDDVNYNDCKKNFTDAVKKYKLEKRAYWGPVSDTTMGAAQSFREVMQKANVPHQKLLLTTVKFAVRRTHWSLKHVLGSDVLINTYGASDNSMMDDPRWWRYPSSRGWVVVETQKMAGYFFYYGLLGNKETHNIREKDIPVK
jgi:hypothetical protein